VSSTAAEPWAPWKPRSRGAWLNDRFRGQAAVAALDARPYQDGRRRHGLAQGPAVDRGARTISPGPRHAVPQPVVAAAALYWTGQCFTHWSEGISLVWISFPLSRSVTPSLAAIGYLLAHAHGGSICGRSAVACRRRQRVSDRWLSWPLRHVADIGKGRSRSCSSGRHGRGGAVSPQWSAHLPVWLGFKGGKAWRRRAACLACSRRGPRDCGRRVRRHRRAHAVCLARSVVASVILP